MTTDLSVLELLIATGCCTDDEFWLGTEPSVVYRMTEDAASPPGRLSLTCWVKEYWPCGTSLVGASGTRVSFTIDLLVPEIVPAGMVKVLLACSVPSESPVTWAWVKLTE